MFLQYHNIKGSLNAYLGKGSKKKKYGNFHTFAGPPPPKVWKINKKNKPPPLRDKKNMV